MMVRQPPFGATQPGPQAPHPTVDYGQPGGQMQTQVLPTGPQYGPPQVQPQNQGYGGYDPSMIPPPAPVQSPSGVQYPGQRPPANYQQAPQVPQHYGVVPGQQQAPAQYGYGQQYGQAPQQFPQNYQPPQPYPVQQQAPQAPYGQQQFQQPRGQYDPNQVLDGPNVPAELRGRTWGQAMQIYSQLASDYLNRRSQQQGQQGQQPQGQQFQQPQQQGQPQGFRAPQRDGQGGWRQDIREEVQQAVAPVTNFALQQQLKELKGQVAQSIPDWQHLGQEVEQMLQAADPMSLLNPQVWESAADLVRGRRARAQQAQGFQNGQPQPSVVQTPYGLVPLQGGPQNGYATVPQPQAQYPQAQYGGPAAVPAQQAPIPQYQFFTEGPTPPLTGQASALLTPQEREYARKMGMDEYTYLAWKGGVLR